MHETRSAATSPPACRRSSSPASARCPTCPAENYWFRRHLAVYEWIAERCAGLDVVDMACGEGYGTEVLARRAARGHRRGREPRGPRARARSSTRGPGVRFERDLVETYSEPCDAVVFLQTIEHVQDPAAVLDHFKSMLRPGGRLRVHAERAHARARRAPRSRATRGTCASTAPRSSARSARASSTRSSCSASSTRASCALHELALRAGWDARARRACGSPSRFYDCFTPAISARDFALRPGPLDRALDFVAVLR